ncbi:MAG: extracellular solute-binding protein [Mesorhizobium sp.]|jgi:multiple sugar transport system substrate-binding protein|uniref:extracellular solute-binding protein n=1 Tax=Mesorhizobium sp. TaxID=1871066 RepID=UPI000FEA15A6|nr:extracellular solute-binding protein [Mesorhizobium sp.]RWO08080.1 MAG: extracellular solute-binding protein [Mesorhizobium sp.]RWO25456.1 MAG: extracellular solute-binding protein [Mesorhizobium sp.]RWO41250.1 MAG: extracellular solute-binding protein [Mesorhizobium sp.]RWO75836.1 MAG: extracellular solute-binding protein [Mesorhizobium sp.]RWP17543.1 MAG: extracellular solute-binding protein [Mesorhizobium sp.]
MNDHEKRDFQAGLEAEVDAFMRGETTRRTFITRFGQMTGMLAASGPILAMMTDWALAQQKLELADAASPLGQAQAAAMKASMEGPADGSAFRAVEAAKAHSGVTLNMTYEAGLQALDPRNFSGPMWEQLTGMKSNVVELSNPDQYSKAVAEHIAGSGAYDVLDISPAWTPSLADGGVIAPLDDYIAKYMNPADLEDYHPLYKALPTYKGKIWGFFDDGDMFALYYRKDIFEDPKMVEAYQAKFNAKLAPPKTWEEYAQIAQFITDQMAPNVYGAGHFRKAGSPGNQFDFLQQYRANGGKLFGDDMKAGLVSDAGVKTLQNMIAANAASIPGNNELDAVSLWAAFLTGKVAMIYSWPPSGRMAANYSQSATAINFIPQSQIAGKVGYAVVPGNPEHATGYNKALSADSANPEAAYLFMQWACSPPVSLARCMLPYALRDPYRISHFKSELYGALFPSAKEYLSNLNNSANVGLLDPIMPGAQDYFLSIDRMCTAVWAGADPKASLETAAAEWNETTDRLGVDSQKAFYTEFLKLPGATADNTVEKLGMAVTL